MYWLAALFRHWFGDSVARVEAEAEAYRTSPAGRLADTKTIWVLLTVAVSLVFMHYAGHPHHVQPLVCTGASLFDGDEGASDAQRTLLRLGYDQSSALMWWGIVSIAAYTILPIFVIKLIFRERLSDYGLKLKGMFAGWPIYLVFIACMGPLVFLFSAEERFQQTYPFFFIAKRDLLTADFFRWELIYACQFVALEFFFRGFMVHGLKRRFGVYSVFAMMVPYCMIHFGKPLPECLASIVAGIVLGFMSLKTKSIWLGAALHISVAWSMDFASLYRRGLIG